MQAVTISLPETVYRRLQHAAEIAGKPITEIATQSIQESLPPLLEAIPARFRADLQIMQQFADDELWRIARSVVVPKDQRRYRRLLRKNSSAALSIRERQTLTELRATADKIMLQKAYAYLLLKWRGYRIPTLTELA